MISLSAPSNDLTLYHLFPSRNTPSIQIPSLHHPAAKLRNQSTFAKNTSQRNDSLSRRVPAQGQTILYGGNSTPLPSNPIPHACIDILPPELLSEIFMSCIPTGGWRPRNRSPITLSHVSARWRALALSLPCLWSIIALDSTHCFSGRPNRRLQLWLERSRGRPLKMFLPHDAHTSMMSVVIANIHRCDELILDLDSDRAACAAFGIPFSQAARLHTLSIRTCDCRPQALEKLCALARTAPNIRQLNWDDDRDYAPRTLLELSWAQLSHITIAGELSPEQFCLLLRSPNLESLNVGIDLFTSALPPSIAITHRKLSSLSVHTSHFADLSAFLNILTLPSLRILSLYFRHKSDDPHIHTALDNMLARSGCKLEALTLDFALERDIVACIVRPSLRFIRELDLSCCDHISRQTLNLLFYAWPSSQDTSILPFLSKLSMSSCATPDGMIAEMITSRVWQTSSTRDDGAIIERTPLSFVAVDFWQYPEPKRGYTKQHNVDNEGFETLIEEGVDIRRLWSINRTLP